MVPGLRRSVYLALVTTDPFASIPSDLIYVALLFALFVVPKALQRYRIPSAITSLLMGVGASALDLFSHNDTIHGYRSL